MSVSLNLISSSVLKHIQMKSINHNTGYLGLEKEKKKRPGNNCYSINPPADICLQCPTGEQAGVKLNTINSTFIM